MPTDFNAKADEFIARIQSANITASTDVVLIFHLVKADDGSPIPPVEISIAPSTTVKGGPSQEQRRQFARSVFIGQIIANINSLVRPLSSEPIQMRETGDRLVIVQDVEMEIIDSQS